MQLQPHKPFSFCYLLSAYRQSPQWPPGGRVIATRTGASARPGDNSRGAC